MASNEENVNVFSKKFTGGPLGLGDPDDRTLRHVEDHVFITQLVKDRAHHEKCNDLISSKPLISNFLFLFIFVLRIWKMHGTQ